MYTRFFFFFNISGAERAFALTSVGLGFAPDFPLDFDFDTRFAEDLPPEAGFDLDDLPFNDFEGPLGLVGAMMINGTMAVIF